MLPSNVVSFMKKMVTTEGQAPEDTTLSKLRQTLSTSLMTAQDKMSHKLSSSTRPHETIQPEPVKPPEEPPPPKPQKAEGKPVPRHGACRVCLKSFKEDDFSKTCGECQQKVCEDCASYSKQDEAQDEGWRCSICRRRAASRCQAMAQDSTDSLLDAPVLEALQRRHSDAKIGSSSSGVGAGGGGLAPSSTGLAPPRSPELRRHSDVSPASLKELEKAVLKVASEREWRTKGGGRGGGSPQGSRATSPSVERRPFPSQHQGHQQQQPPSSQLKIEEPGGDPHGGGGGGDGGGGGHPGDDPWRRSAHQASSRRRKSRVAKQHSYDEETKPTAVGVPQPTIEPAPLGLPNALPRRASAYDVYAPLPQQQPTRRASFRGGAPLASSAVQEPPLPPPPVSVSGLEDHNGGSPLSPETGGSSLSLGLEEDRRSRRRGSQLPDISSLRGSRGSIVPGSAAVVAHPVTSVSGGPGSGGGRLSDASDLSGGSVRRQTSVTDGEAIKIVIHDVDCDSSFGPRTTSKRRVTLRRDPTDKAHRTRGFGMRVVGGKVGHDGRLFAYIVWTVPGGPAEKGGLQQGDKVLEWGGLSLVDKTFEDVCAIMDRTGDSVELLVEHGNDLRMCDLLDEPQPATARKNSGEGLNIGLEGDPDKSPASPTRRKLPKTPGSGVGSSGVAMGGVDRSHPSSSSELQPSLQHPPASSPQPSPPPPARERCPVSGRVQLQVWYNDDKSELVVSVFAADDLAPRDDPIYGNQPEAYLQLRLLPFTGELTAVKTDVAEPNTNPMWNTTLELKVQGEQLMEKSLEVTLWDYKPDKEQVFLGECCVDLQKALLDDTPVWYRLEDPRQLRSPRSPRSSIASDTSVRTLRRGDRSLSETSDPEGDGLGGFLHPDHAYIGGSRRGSSQSENLDLQTEPYQLNKDFSRSLPGSRRSSFQSNQEKEGDAPPANYSKERRRSSICRAMRDPDEILRSLKAVKGELLSRSGSMSHKRRTSRSGSVAVERKFLETQSSDEDDKWSTKSEPRQLGPGQIQPRGYQLKGGQAEIKLSLLMTKGQLEVEVISARGIRGEPPDTYVKTYLRDGERWLQKRKTRVCRHCLTPQFRQTLRYAACDVAGRSLLVMLWSKSRGFDSNVGLGGAEVGLESLPLSQLTVGWYPLFPIHTLGSDSNDSP